MGVFSTRERAQDLIDAMLIDGKRSWDYFEIDEREIDEISPGGRNPWFVKMKKDGSVVEVERTTEMPEDEMEESYRATLSCVVWAVDETHAVKIANERRTAWLLKHGESSPGSGG